MTDEELQRLKDQHAKMAPKDRGYVKLQALIVSEEAARQAKPPEKRDE